MHIHMVSWAHYFMTLSVLHSFIYLSEIVVEKLCLHSECLRVSSEFSPCPYNVFGVQCDRQLSAFALSVFALSPHKNCTFFPLSETLSQLFVSTSHSVQIRIPSIKGTALAHNRSSLMGKLCAWPWDSVCQILKLPRMNILLCVMHNAPLNYFPLLLAFSSRRSLRIFNVVVVVAAAPVGMEKN